MASTPTSPNDGGVACVFECLTDGGVASTPVSPSNRSMVCVLEFPSDRGVASKPVNPFYGLYLHNYMESLPTT